MIYPKAFKSFLIAMDGTGQSGLVDHLFMDLLYIDSPGSYQDEKKSYNGIIDFYDSAAVLDEFWKFYNMYPDHVAAFMSWYKNRRQKGK